MFYFLALTIAFDNDLAASLRLDARPPPTTSVIAGKYKPKDTLVNSKTSKKNR